MNGFLALLIAAKNNRLPLGRCACHEPTIKWCTRHGRPLRREIRGQTPKPAAAGLTGIGV